MKSRKKTAASVSKRVILPQLFGLIVLGRAADAQSSVPQTSTLQPLAPPVESVTSLNMTNEFQVFAPRPAASAPGPYEPFQWDQFVLRPHFDYQFMVAHGILASPGNPQNTTIQYFSPGILLNLGPHWALDYTLGLGFYSNNNFSTEVNNSIVLTGQTFYRDWVIGFLQNALLSTSPLIETGGQTTQQTFDTVITGHHETSEHTSLDLQGAQSLQFFSGGGFENVRSWSTTDWFNYEPQSHFNIGIGPGLGYNNVDFGPDSLFVQAQGRLSWRISQKLSVQLSGGAQETKFLGNTAVGNVFSPIYGGSIQYQPFSETEFAVYASRSFSPSAFVGQYTDSTSFGATLSQRFLGQFYASLNAGYGHQEYVASSIFNTTGGRTDKFYSLAARLSHSFLERGSVAIFYMYGQDNSSLPGYSYSSNQYGVEVSYSF